MGYFSLKMTPNIAYLLIFLILAVGNSFAEGTYSFAGIPFEDPTLGPININTSTAHYLSLPPLRLVLVKSEITQFENTGQIMLAKLAQRFSSSTMTGGVLGNDIYEFVFFRFYFTQDLNKSGTDSINNDIIPLIASADFKNRKYRTVREALKYRFGLAEFAMPFKICSTKNSRYDKFGKKVKEITQPGSSTEASLGTLMEGLDFVAPEGRYYAYPAAIPDANNSSRIHFCVTVNLMVPTDEMCITKKQFESTFGSMKNSSGQPMDASFPANSNYTLPVVGAKGVLQTFLP